MTSEVNGRTCGTCGLASPPSSQTCPRCGRSLIVSPSSAAAQPITSAPTPGVTVRRSTLSESPTAEPQPGVVDRTVARSRLDPDAISPPHSGTRPVSPALPDLTSTAASPGAPASLGTRLLANLLDSALGTVAVLVAVWLPSLLLTSTSSGRGPSGVLGLLWWVLALAVYALLIGYGLVPVGRIGQTIGKRTLGVQVVGWGDGAPIGVGRSFLRALGFWLMGLPCDLGYLSILVDKSGYRRGWQDGLANSVVIAVPPVAFGAAVRDVLRAMTPGWKPRADG